MCDGKPHRQPPPNSNLQLQDPLLNGTANDEAHHRDGLVLHTESQGMKRFDDLQSAAGSSIEGACCQDQKNANQ